MRYRRLGRAGIQISELTFGTSPPELAPSSDNSAALNLALECGVNAMEFQGGGIAEQRLASMLGNVRSDGDWHLLSRVPSLVRFDLPSPHVPAFEAYPGDHIRRCTEATLTAFCVERIACQQIHAWCPEWLGEGDWLDVLQRLKDEGKIGAIGVSLFDHDVDAGLDIVASGMIDCLQVMFNLFDQGATRRLFDLCEQHEVGVIARSPLYFGALSARVHQAEPFRVDDWRWQYFYEDHLAEVRGRVEALECAVAPFANGVEESALRFCLSHEAVSTVAVGMSNPSQVRNNLRTVELGRLVGQEVAALAYTDWLSSRI